MKLHFLGLAADIRHPVRYLFARGKAEDVTALEKALEKRYGGTAMAVKNGRSALAFALKGYLRKGDKVIVNGFTCYAVVEAVRAAGCIPVYADIDRGTLNFNAETLDKVWASIQDQDTVTAIIVQNTMGNPVDIKAVERFAGKHGLLIFEDLAHTVGGHYLDGREIGTIGMATALSFGKDKAIDTVSGGAVIFRYPCKARIQAPINLPKKSDVLRARWYPMFGAACRHLTRIHLGGILMRVLVRMHFVEKSADNRLDLTRKIAPYQAKLALEQFERARGGRVRDYYFVNSRAEVLKKLKAAGYYFDGFWYEKPISPERYYKKAGFNEAECPVATEAARTIINFPKYYPAREMLEAQKIIRPYLISENETAPRGSTK